MTSADDPPPDAQNLDNLIHKLIDCYFHEVGREKPPVQMLTIDEVIYVINRAKDVLSTGSALAEIEAPLCICGDTHGQFSDVIRIFQSYKWPPDQKYLFLGDYVDRGPYSVETICLMFLLKIRHPKYYYILRGNHECENINRVYGFLDECRTRYGGEFLWQKFQPAFDLLPVAALVSNKIFCMHGGLSPYLCTLQQIRNMQLPLASPGGPGLLADLLWSDPDKSIQGFRASPRGISYNFGEDVVHNFCAKHGLDLIIRAHQVVHDGYEFFANKKLITIFSAPNYCGQFENMSGTIHVDENLTCSIRQFRPHRERVR